MVNLHDNRLHPLNSRWQWQHNWIIKTLILTSHILKINKLLGNSSKPTVFKLMNSITLHSVFLLIYIFHLLLSCSLIPPTFRLFPSSTTENVAVFIWKEMTKSLQSNGRLLYKVVIWETDKNKFTYKGEEIWKIMILTIISYYHCNTTACFIWFYWLMVWSHTLVESGLIFWTE